MDMHFPDHDQSPAGGGFMDALFEPSGVPGVQARTALHEDIVDRLAALITTLRPDGAEALRFPPVMPRADLEASGYLASFPNLLGCVCALSGSDAEIEAAAARHGKGGEWTSSLAASDLVLAPAACYPVYPLAARRGPLPAAGLCFDVACECFRREPSSRLDRLQSFRMREYVCIGDAAQVLAFREAWIGRGRELAASLQLQAEIALANDPFFGREGRMKAVSQIHQAAKFELLVPIYATKPTACMSFNYHRDHFGKIWSLRGAAGETAHTGCAAFGMDRLALAMFATHGLEPARWPAGVRRALGL
jgi:seryl-tRNA synthetase